LTFGLDTHTLYHTLEDEEAVSNSDPMEPRTLRENVADLLRRAIIEGSLPPGAELTQAQIAEKLGISRGPLREALGRLEQEGLMRSIAYKGVYVTPLTKKYLGELSSMRAALEAFALSRSIPRARAEDIDRLNHIVDEMRQTAHEREARCLVQLDLAFHEYLVRIADHDLLYKMWKLLEIGVQRCLHTRHKIYETLDEVVGTHPALVAAIRDRDMERASQLLTEHIAEAGEQMCRHWAEDNPDGQEATGVVEPGQSPAEHR